MLRKISRLRGSGSHISTEYVYVLDGGKLKPFPLYAKRLGSDNLREYYMVDEDHLKDKPIIAFSFTKSGGLFARQYRIQDFDIEGRPSLNKGVDVNVFDFCGKFYLDADESMHLNEFSNMYVGAIRDIKNYISKMEVELQFTGRQERFREAYEHECPIGCLAQYKGRVTCMKNVKRWIYQLWILKLVFEAINVNYFMKLTKFEDKPSIRLGQGKPGPAAYVNTPYGNATIWFEFQPISQPIRGAQLIDANYKRKISIRPDVVVLKGLVEYSNYKTKELMSRMRDSVIIECKEDEYGEWKDDIERQLNDYRQIYNPRHLIVASLKSCPTIRCADCTFSNLNLNTLKEIGEFKSFIREAFEKL